VINVKIVSSVARMESLAIELSTKARLTYAFSCLTSHLSLRAVIDVHIDVLALFPHSSPRMTVGCRMGLVMLSRKLTAVNGYDVVHSGD
jgi:hypothetical protein